MCNTSYFAGYKGVNGISIAMRPPRGMKVIGYPELFPKKEFLFKYKKSQQTEKDQKDYIKSYYDEVLGKLDPMTIYNNIKDKTILCYEKYGDFCHRRIVARWLFLCLGIVMSEKHPETIDLPVYEYLDEIMNKDQILKREAA